MRYGLPYKGNKSTIASKIFNDLPRHLNFYDLFGGGGAMTHYALFTGAYTSIHYNEINPLVADFFRRALCGEYKDETRWISRDDFYRLKDTDGFVKIVWSFGNNGQTYLYGKEVEPFNKALHYAIVYGDYSLMKEYNGWDLSVLDKYETCNERLYHLKEFLETRPDVYKYYGKGRSHYCWKQFTNIDYIRYLTSTQRVQKLELNLTPLPSITSTDYQKVSILPNSILYCDIPYNNTGEYDTDFDYERFYEWAYTQKELVVVSEYTMPDDFICIAEYDKRALFSPTVKNKVAKEKLFIPSHQKELYETLMNEFRLF